MDQYNEHLQKLTKDKYPCETNGDMNMYHSNYLIGRDALFNNDEFFCIYGLKILGRNFPYPTDQTLYAVHDGRQDIMWSNHSDQDKPKQFDKCPVCGREILLYQ